MAVSRTSFLDQEWFTFETAGTLVVGWEGGPARQTSAVGLAASPRKIDEPVSALNALDLAVDQDRPKTTGIEFAAAAATGLYLLLTVIHQLVYFDMDSNWFHFFMMCLISTKLCWRQHCFQPWGGCSTPYHLLQMF